MLRLVSVLEPSDNTLRAIFVVASEIATRDRKTLASVLQNREIEQILQDDLLNRKEKQRRIRSVLENQRYPLRAKLEQAVSDRVAKLRREVNLRVQPPLDLEGDCLTVTVSARSVEEILERAESLRSLAEHRATRELFSLLSGEFIPESDLVETRDSGGGKGEKTGV